MLTIGSDFRGVTQIDHGMTIIGIVIVQPRGLS